MTEDEMVGWMASPFNGCDFEQLWEMVKDTEAGCAAVHGVDLVDLEAHSQCSRSRVPLQDRAPAAHRSKWLNNTHFISSIPSLSHFPTFLPAFPGIAFQINYL